MRRPTPLPPEGPLGIATAVRLGRWDAPVGRDPDAEGGRESRERAAAARRRLVEAVRDAAARPARPGGGGARRPRAR